MPGEGHVTPGAAPVPRCLASRRAAMTGDRLMGRMPDIPFESLAGLLPDLPRWVEVRSLLLSGRGSILGVSDQNPPAFVALEMQTVRAAIFIHRLGTRAASRFARRTQ